MQLLRKLRENSLRPSEKKPATLLNIHHFTSIFQGISLGLKQFFVTVYKDWPGKYNNTFKN